MIFFNITEARDELLNKGLVYTLRSEFRGIGRTEAVMGSYGDHEKLCRVKVSRIMTIRGAFDLIPYVNKSGFNMTEDWIRAASNTARTLYKVERIDETELG